MKKKGFTLVELLAVIVILAIILVIAIPQITKVIKQTRVNAMASTAKLILAKAEEKEVENEALELTETITCGDLVKLDDNYDSANCTITKNAQDKWEVSISGATGKKFEGITCTGTKDNMTCTDGSSNNNTQTAAKEIILKYNDGDNEEGLILVNTNEYRYSGSTVKNYVNFNNETWRIVGIFDGKIKLMRDELLKRTAQYSHQWNDTFNAWEGSDIEVGLNGDYLTSTKYLGSSLSSAAQSIIDNTTWYVSNVGTIQNTASAYAAERPSTGAVTYEGKVGLINPSDYGYASSGCYNGNTKLEDYNDSTCISTNWMYINDKDWWTNSPWSYTAGYSNLIYSNGSVDGSSIGYSTGIRPTVYLMSNVKLASTSGDGSSAQNAYVFEYIDNVNNNNESGPNTSSGRAVYAGFSGSVCVQFSIGEEPIVDDEYDMFVYDSYEESIAGLKDTLRGFYSCDYYQQEYQNALYGYNDCVSYKVEYEEMSQLEAENYCSEYSSIVEDCLNEYNNCLESMSDIMATTKAVLDDDGKVAELYVVLKYNNTLYEFRTGVDESNRDEEDMDIYNANKTILESLSDDCEYGDFWGDPMMTCTLDGGLTVTLYPGNINISNEHYVEVEAWGVCAS